MCSTSFDFCAHPLFLPGTSPFMPGCFESTLIEEYWTDTLSLQRGKKKKQGLHSLHCHCSAFEIPGINRCLIGPQSIFITLLCLSIPNAWVPTFYLFSVSRLPSMQTTLEVLKWNGIDSRETEIRMGWKKGLNWGQKLKSNLGGPKLWKQMAWWGNRISMEVGSIGEATWFLRMGKYTSSSTRVWLPWIKSLW